MKGRKLVHGVGVNDADYPITKNTFVDGKRVHTWICPFYDKWKSMLLRCYSNKRLLKYPAYIGCSVVPEWHYFMTFRAWMIQQDWKDKHLDKDILFPGNRAYGPDTCVFVDKKVNNFLTERQNHRGDWPIGVSFHKASGKFRAKCCDIITGKQEQLGYYTNPEEAHQAWLTYKLEQAKILASEQSDPRVAKALVERYENYGN